MFIKKTGAESMITNLTDESNECSSFEIPRSSSLYEKFRFCKLLTIDILFILILLHPQ